MPYRARKVNVSEVAEALPEVAPATEAGAETEALTEQTEQEAKAPEVKPEKTPEQREIERLRRGLDRKTRQLYEARARVQLTPPPIDDTNRQTADDSQPLSLTRAELAEYVKSEAARLAPTLAEQRSEEQRRQGVLQSLAKTWGQEKFDDIASELDAAFDGLKTSSGGRKPAIEAVFESDDPARVIEYLADPEHADEAEAISRMSAAQAGRAVAKLELKLAAAKPQVSKAPAILEPVKGGGPVSKDPSKMTDKEFAAWRREQIKSRS